MNCDEFIKVWTNRLEPFSEVPPDNIHEECNEEPEATHHLQECRRCARKIDTFDFALNLIRDEIQEEPDTALWHNMKAEIKKQLKPTPLRQRFFSRPIFSRQWQPIWGLLPAALVPYRLFSCFFSTVFSNCKKQENVLIRVLICGPKTFFWVAGFVPALVALLLLTVFPFNQVTPSQPENIFLMSGGIPGFEYEIGIENDLITEEDPDSEIIYAAIDNWTDLLAETIEINSNSQYVNQT